MSFAVPNSIVGPFFTLLGLVGLLASLACFARQLLRFRSTVRAEGEVIGSKMERSEGTTESGAPFFSILHFPEVRYRTAAGAEITFRSGLGRGWREYAVGAKVAVRYDPQHPQSAEIDSFWRNWLLTVVSGGIGLVAFLFAFLASMSGAAAR